MSWVTVSIDFSNAFIQSDLPEGEEIWMSIPRGFVSTKGPGYCLKLVKSVYGLKSAPQLWHNHSSEAFKAMGLVQSEYDPCLWYGDDIMVVQYVDDCGVSAPTQKRIDEFVQGLREYGLELTQEGTFEEFLGIKFNNRSDGSIECTQKALIQMFASSDSDSSDDDSDDDRGRRRGRRKSNGSKKYSGSRDSRGSAKKKKAKS